MDPELTLILERGAIQLEDKIKLKILSGVPPPNAPATVARKGSSATLIDTGTLLGSITHIPDGEGFLVGTFDESYPEDSNKMVYEYALINEFGEGHVPERSFLRSTFDEEWEPISQSVAEEICDAIIKRYLAE